MQYFTFIPDQYLPVSFSKDKNSVDPEVLWKLLLFLIWEINNIQIRTLTKQHKMIQFLQLMRIWACDLIKIILSTAEKKTITCILILDVSLQRCFLSWNLVNIFNSLLVIYLKVYKMGRHLRKSLKRNKIRRRSQFKPGHPCLHLRESVGVTFSETKDTSETATPLTSTSRLSSSEFPDVLSVTTSSQSSDSSPIITYRLWPGKDKKYTEASGKRKALAENENIIVNIKKLEDLFNTFAPHSCEAPDSKSVRVSIVERQGLCVSVLVAYKNCGLRPQKVDYLPLWSPREDQMQGV